MSALSANQILQLAQRAGFQPQDAQKFAAVVLAESGGNPRAYNPNASTGDNSYGLAQVNMLGSLGPARRKEFGLSRNEELFNPETNIRAAKRIWDTSGPHAWTTYTSGAYKQYLPTVQRAAGGAPESLPEGETLSSVSNSTSGSISPEDFKNSYVAAMLQSVLETPSMFTPWETQGGKDALQDMNKPVDYFSDDQAIQDKVYGIRPLYMAG